MDKFLAIVPAKANSTRLPNKNIKILNGQPLFMHSVDHATRAGIPCIVSTDNDVVARCCDENGVAFVWENVDEKKMENCCISALEKFPCNYLIVLQPTHPLRRATTILNGIRMIKESKADSLISVTPMRPLFFKNEKPLFDPRERKITQQTSKSDFYYYFDGVLLITSSKLLKEENILFDEKTLLLESKPIERYDIHTELDFYVVQSIMQKYENPNL